MPFQKQIIFRAAGALSQGAAIIIKEYFRTKGEIQGQKTYSPGQHRQFQVFLGTYEP